MRCARPADGVLLSGDGSAPVKDCCIGDSKGTWPYDWKDYFRCYVKVINAGSPATTMTTTCFGRVTLAHQPHLGWECRGMCTALPGSTQELPHV